MNQMNQVIIEGYVHETPKLRNTPKGSAFVVLGVRNYRYFKSNGETQKEINYVESEVWGARADCCPAQARQVGR